MGKRVVMKKYAIVLAIFLLAGSVVFTTQAKKKSHWQRKAQTENIKGQQTFTVGGVKFTMITVEGGTFMMGAVDGDTIAKQHEKPAHEVTVSTFSIGQTEVTQELWMAVMGKYNNHSEFRGAKRPVEMISYYDCEEFLEKLNKMTGQKFRFPTEAEWEFAARGGNKSKGYKYYGGNVVGKVAWYKGNSKDKTHPVAQKRPNELGLYDMGGNVWEWCLDWYGEDYFTSSPSTNPTGPETGSNRVNRGGHWGCDTYRFRVSDRDGDIPGSRCPFIGLRLAL